MKSADGDIQRLPRDRRGVAPESSRADAAEESLRPRGASSSPSTPRLVLLVGTGNPHKVEEISAVLADPERTDGKHVEVAGADILPRDEPVEETGETFHENARIKAEAYARLALELAPERRPRWVIADDSGLAVDALRGAPGIHSARYAGPKATARDNNRKLLEAMEGVPASRRGAEFVCVIACVELLLPHQQAQASPHQQAQGPPPRELSAFFAEGRCRGVILTQERGTGGFGYDPLFLVPDLQKTFAELSQEEKNRISHRGRALQVLREKLLERMRIW